MDKSFGKSFIQNLSGLKDIKISDITEYSCKLMSILAFYVICVLLTATINELERNIGYFQYDDTIYYLNDDWYVYDSNNEVWEFVDKTEVPEVIRKDKKNFLGIEWNDSMPCTDWNNDPNIIRQWPLSAIENGG